MCVCERELKCGKRETGREKDRKRDIKKLEGGNEFKGKSYLKVARCACVERTRYI